MKKTINLSIFLILFSSIIFIGCRKKVSSSQELATKPKHCYNNILDADEVTTDAGGSCGSNSSAPLISSCSVANDTFLIGSTIHLITSCLRTTNASSEPVFTLASTGGWSIVITVNANVAYNYTLSSTASLNPGQFEYKGVINDPTNGPMNLTIGDVIIKTNGVDYAVDICNGAYYPLGTPTSVKAFAKQN